MHSIRILEPGPCTTNWILGGASEEHSTTALQHFATISDGARSYTVLVNPDFDFIYDNQNTFITDAPGYLRLSLSQRSDLVPTATKTQLGPPHPLLLTQDHDSDSEAEHWYHHKAHGIPTIALATRIHIPSDYTFIFQICFPGSDDADLDLDWPFHTMTFSLFTSPDALHAIWAKC